MSFYGGYEIYLSLFFIQLFLIKGQRWIVFIAIIIIILYIYFELVMSDPKKSWLWSQFHVFIIIKAFSTLHLFDWTKQVKIGWGQVKEVWNWVLLNAIFRWFLESPELRDARFYLNQLEILTEKSTSLTFWRTVFFHVYLCF